MRFARMNEGGAVLEVVDVSDEEEIARRFPASLGFEQVPDHVDQHWRKSGRTWREPALITPDLARRRATMRVSFRQLVLGLLRDGWIDAAAAEAWATRSAIPAPLLAVMDTMPESDRPAARITALTMAEAHRLDPLLVAAAGAAMPTATPEERDAALDIAFDIWRTL